MGAYETSDDLSLTDDLREIGLGVAKLLVKSTAIITFVTGGGVLAENPWRMGGLGTLADLAIMGLAIRAGFAANKIPSDADLTA